MTSGVDDEHDRRGELAERLSALEARIAAACQAVGRSADEVTLVAVTKTFPASDVVLLASLGVTDIGENRDQEAAPKAARVASLGITAPVRWHFVGQLQVNKVASVVSYADVVHSADRMRLVRALGSRAAAAGRRVTCLIQVNLDDAATAMLEHATTAEPARGGAPPSDVLALADAISAEPSLVLGGVMAVAPLDAPPRPAFHRLWQVAEEVRAAFPAAIMISAGMSGDLEEAIAEGATHVRVGTALLGGRRPFVR